jgi:hypothetical protein
MNHEMLIKTTEIYDKIYSRLMNTVTEQEAKDTWDMYSLDIKYLKLHNNLQYDILQTTYNIIIDGHNHIRGKRYVQRNSQTTQAT